MLPFTENEMILIYSILNGVGYSLHTIIPNIVCGLEYEDTSKIDLTSFLTKLHDLTDFEIGELDNLVQIFWNSRKF